MSNKGSMYHRSSEFYESAFTPVSPENRKNTTHVLMVTMGYTVSLSCFMIGSKVGHALPFGQAVLACILGNLILMVIGTFMGIIGFKTGWSTAFLMRKFFGKHASILLSVLLVLLCLYWVGMNGDSFANMIVTAFPRWPIPTALTAVLLIALWAITAAYGWRGLALTSCILTPITVMLAMCGAGQMHAKINIISTIQNFVPSGGFTVSTAIAAVTGNYIFGCIISPDLCRFVKSKKSVVQVIVPSYTIGFILLNLCGVLVAQLSNSPEFGAGVAKLGLALPYLICSAMALWTTENYNMYCGSLATQNLFLGTPLEGNLSHRLATGVLAGLAATFAALKLANYSMPIITLIAALVPPIAGMLFVEYFYFYPKQKYAHPVGSGWCWIPAWVLGGTAGIWSFYAKFLISPINALVVAGVVYAVLKILTEHKNNKHTAKVKN